MRHLLQSESLQTGFVMVKPHAFDAALDPLIGEILAGSGLAIQLEPSDQLRPVLDNLTVGNPIIRNLAAVAYGSKFLDLLYGDKATRRYYPLIYEYYLGRVAIIPYFYRGEPADMPLVYDALKGTTETYDAHGKQHDKSTGLRGLLGEPYQFHDNQSSSFLDDDTYLIYFTPEVNNYIHVSDSRIEIDTGLQLLYAADEWKTAVKHVVDAM